MSNFQRLWSCSELEFNKYQISNAYNFIIDGYQSHVHRIFLARNDLLNIILEYQDL